ncbi:hypothetical protein BASA81_005531 [Batrachochytrium salamandrivorans]|nr:hypothetical protein BASA81_005531 [Batrachochytrium salamandrivorans]
MNGNVDVLVALGYPQAWCVRALQTCGNNLDDAVEFMLTNAEFLEEVVRETERAQLCKQVREREAEEDSWMDSVAQEFGFTTTSVGNGKEQHKWMLEGGEVEEEEEWGFKIIVTPCYSHRTAKLLVGDGPTQNRLDLLVEQVSVFTHQQDVALVQLVSEYCAKEGLDPLGVSPATILQNPKVKSLLPHSPTQIGLRFVVLRNFNRRLLNLLPLIDLSSPTSKLACKLNNLRAVVFTQVKRQLLERTLRESNTGDATSLQVAKLPSVVLDRTNLGNKPLNVFGQLFTQIHRRIPPNELRNADRAFYCVLAGEHSDDFGGPYRDALNQACEELMSSTATLFCACPSNSQVFVPNPKANTHAALEMFEFLGILMGIAMRTKCPLPLRLAGFSWKKLCGLPTTVSDLLEIDSQAYNLLLQLERITTKQEWDKSELDLKFCLRGDGGKVEEELISGGRRLSVTFDSRLAFCNLAKKKLLQQGQQQYLSMRRGMATQVPLQLVSALFTWEELNVLVCGVEEIDLALLRKCTSYGAGVSSEMIESFWYALESFSHEERKRYIKFVWGRTTMPTSAAGFDRKHQINLMDVRQMYRNQHRGNGDDEDDDEDSELDNWHVNADAFLPEKR